MTLFGTRLRRGEVIAGAAAVVLTVAVFALPWYGLTGAAQRSTAALGISTTHDGWNSLWTVRWLIALTVIAAFTLVYVQATRRAPALPASMSTFTLVLGVLCSLALIYRVLLNVPGPAAESAQGGAYIGLLSALVLTAGAFWSLREEDPLDPERSAAIPVVRLQ